MTDENMWPSEKALLRYQVISAYLATQPSRGQRGLLLKQLASKDWSESEGQSLYFSAETIRSWVRRYRQAGIAGLEDKPRPRRGVQVMSPELVETVCSLKREVPERSLDRILRILDSMGLSPPNTVRRSTLHRVLQAAGLSRRPRRKTPEAKDLDRFEADRPNELWQSDLLVGPWLEDPQRPSKMRRAYLYAFVDDHSRLLLHGRFSFKGELPALELVFRRCLQRWGLCTNVYYDNGQVYRSHHMKQIVATLGIHRRIFTTPGRPEGHGKIEALNGFIRDAFLAELKATNIKTLDELNEAFVSWADYEYNRRNHTEIGQAPLSRWRAGAERIVYPDERRLRDAFLWTEHRTPDKTGLFSLFGTRYQVNSELARRRIEVRYDPEELDEVEVHLGGQFVQRARPFEVRRHRRPKVEASDQAKHHKGKNKPVANWLGHLVDKRRKDGFIEPSPRQHVEDAKNRRREADARILNLLSERLDAAVWDESAAQAFLDRYGPFDCDLADKTLARLFELGGGRTDLHQTFYLEGIRQDSTHGDKQ